MGQLIKLQDYISRYELDIYKYPARFIRLKRLQWQQLYKAWEEGRLENSSLEMPNVDMAPEPEKKENFIGKIKAVMTKNKQDHTENEEVPVRDVTLIDDEDLLESRFSFFHLKTLPKTANELKRHFLEEIFKVQIQWASSTAFEQSTIDPLFLRERNLKYFMQRFPDTFLVLYQPVFRLKKAEIGAETIILTPLEAICISFLEFENDAVFVGSEEHFWEKRYGEEREKVLNPLISLNRTETIMKGIWKQENIDLPISKVLISRNGYIDFPSVSFGITLVDQRDYSRWFEKMRGMKAPMKNGQLKAARALLNYCQTISHSRIY